MRLEVEMTEEQLNLPPIKATPAGTSLIFGVFSGIFNIIFLTILIRVFMM